MTPNLEGALRVFVAASEYVACAGLLSEVEWQRQIKLDDFSESDLLRECAWVILCSGFREQVVRRVFDHISLCFCDWESASAILDADPACRIAAMASFRNAVKLSAIVRVALHIQARGFTVFKEAVLADPISELRHLPHIGPITVWHLAKNLGLDAAKPDRHLTRISRRFGFDDAGHFCAEIARSIGEQRKVVDLVVWRYMADNPQIFSAKPAIGGAFGS
jgi:endonuclease III